MLVYHLCASSGPTEIVEYVIFAIQTPCRRQHNVTMAGTSHEQHQSRLVCGSWTGSNVPQFDESPHVVRAHMDHVASVEFYWRDDTVIVMRAYKSNRTNDQW